MYTKFLYLPLQNMLIVKLQLCVRHCLFCSFAWFARRLRLTMTFPVFCVLQSTKIDRKFPSSVVVVVSRRSEEMSVWLHGMPNASVTLAISASQQRLHVEDHRDEHFSPGDATIEFLEGMMEAVTQFYRG